ncbi:MAG: archease [Dehalococcoidia bacterium]|nr:archease [Dehalococcoidia bacterium]
MMIANSMQNQGFEIIEHTADTGIAASGATLSEAFASAAAGLFSIITDMSKVREAQSRLVEVSGPDIEVLLFNWMNELIYIFDVDHMLFNRFEVTALGDTLLKAVCYGEKYDPDVHDLLKDVKSATLHKLEVDRTKNKVRVILDV